MKKCQIKKNFFDTAKKFFKKFKNFSSFVAMLCDVLPQ